MRITIGGNTRKYMKTLGIKEYPFSEEELKAQFKCLVKMHHPDTNKSDHATEKTRLVIEAYENLKNLAVSKMSEADRLDAQEKFEKSMEDVFKGKLWNDCPRCNGTRKVQEELPILKECPVCDGEGCHYPSCRICKGTGKWTLKSGRVVACKVCDGSGKYKKIRYPQPCFACAGMGKVVIDHVMKQVECNKCCGLGKIEVKPFNPVIRMGAVMV